MSFLHLVLKGKYYDQILAGTKTVEYRDNTPFWRKRIFKTPRLLYVTFYRGYTNTTISFHIEKIVDVDPIQIHLGERLKE